MQSTVRLASPELPELPELPESGNCQELPEIVGGVYVRPENTPIYLTMICRSEFAKLETINPN